MTNYDPDNPDQQMIHQCIKYARKHLNPIIDWTTDEVWEFIHKYDIPYCKLYDEGFKRLGCIGCPMGTKEQRIREFEKWPTYRRAYIRAFDQMIQERIGGGTETKLEMEQTSNTHGQEEDSKYDGLIPAEISITDKKIVATPKWDDPNRTGEDVMKWWIK